MTAPTSICPPVYLADKLLPAPPTTARETAVTPPAQDHQDLRAIERRDEDKSTHELVLEMFRSHTDLTQTLHAHIDSEPKVIQMAIDSAIDRLVPNGDADGHKNYHQSIINAVAAKQKASEAEQAFWDGLRRDAMRGGILGLGKVTLICLGLFLAYRIGYKGPMPW